MKQSPVILGLLLLVWAGHAQEAAPVVTVCQPLLRDAAHFDFPCRLEAATVIELRAPISGTIDRVLVKAGAEVKAGDILVEIGTASLKRGLEQAEDEAQRLEAQHQQVSQTLMLAEKAGASKEDLFRLAAERDLAGVRHRLAQIEIDRLRRDLEQAVVKAPADGRIEKVQVAPGRFVVAGAQSATHLATLLRTDPVRAYFEVDQRNLLRARELLRQPSGPARDITDLPVHLRLEGETSFPHAGKLTYVERQADPKTGKVRCHAEFANAGGALTGELLAEEKKRRAATVRVTAGESKEILLMVESAILSGPAGEKSVLVVNARNVVEARPVKLGLPREGLQAIESGLKADEWVVIGVERPKDDPQRKLSPGDFAEDVRLLRVRPGTTVKAIQVEMPTQQRALKKAP